MSKNPSYDFICFSDLAYEFDSSESKQIEQKIKRRLKYYNLGAYKQEQVEYIRELKNDLYAEITKYNKSIYYLGARGKYADPGDYNFEIMKKDYCKKYPLINETDMVSFLNFAIYLYYLR